MLHLWQNGLATIPEVCLSGSFSSIAEEQENASIAEEYFSQSPIVSRVSYV